jgi:serine protease Do
MPSTNGVLVAQVEPNSPAAKAGIRPEDIILEYNGSETKTPRELSAAVADSKVGAIAKVKLVRDGKQMTLDVPIGQKPSEIAANENSQPDSDNNAHAKLGLSVQNVDTETSKQLKLSSPGGALVTDVQSGSAADDGDVRPGDVIRGINHKPVNNVSDLRSVTKDLKNGSTVLLNVIRDGQSLFLTFELS